MWEIFRKSAHLLGKTWAAVEVERGLFCSALFGFASPVTLCSGTCKALQGAGAIKFSDWDRECGLLDSNHQHFVGEQGGDSLWPNSGT